MKTKKQNYFLTMAVLASLLFSMVLVSAATTIDSPASSTVIGCGPMIQIQANTTSQPLIGQPVNLTIYAKSALTANSSWSQIAVNKSLNLSVSANTSITSINFTGLLEDASDYIINVTFTNETDVFLGTATITSMVIDCSSPGTPSTLVPTSTSNGTFTFYSTVVGTNVIACSINFEGTNPGYTYATATHSGNLCTFTPTTAIAEGTYKYYFNSTDGLNKSANSAVQTVTIDLGKSGGRFLTQQQNEAQNAGNKISQTLTNDVKGIPVWLIGLVIVIIVIIVIKSKR